MDITAASHLATTLTTDQLDSLASLLDGTDWTSEVRTVLFDALMGAGRRIEADELTDPYIESEERGTNA